MPYKDKEMRNAAARRRNRECPEIRQAAMARYYAKHRAALLEKAKAKRKEQPELIAAQVKARRLAHPERFRGYSRTYKLRHPARVLQNRRASRARNRERINADTAARRKTADGRNRRNESYQRQFAKDPAKFRARACRLQKRKRDRLYPCYVKKIILQTAPAGSELCAADIPDSIVQLKTRILKSKRHAK